jgi:hypothetical protein
MIEPIRAKPKTHAVQDLVAPEPPEAKAEPQDQPGTPAALAAEALHRVPPAKPGFEVHLDGQTLRLYSELRDPETDRLILRLPTGYQPKVPEPVNHKPTKLDV